MYITKHDVFYFVFKYKSNSVDYKLSGYLILFLIILQTK